MVHLFVAVVLGKLHEVVEDHEEEDGGEDKAEDVWLMDSLSLKGTKHLDEGVALQQP